MAASGALALGALAGLPAPASADTPLTVRIVNDSGVPDAQVFVLATADGSHAASIPVNGTGVALTSPGITQVSPGRGGTGGTYDITVTDLVSGSFWLSYCSPVGNAPRPSPMTSAVRFDQVELTYNGTSDQSVWSDLTAVSMWGLPIDLAFYDGAGGRLSQYDRSNGSRDAIMATLTGAGVQAGATRLDDSGRFLRIVSPVILASAFPSLQGYVMSVAGTTIQVNGTYSKAGDPNTGPYRYSGTFEADGSITLSGTVTQNGGTGPGTAVRVQGEWLWGPAPGMPGFGVYMQNGPYSVNGAIPNGGALANDVYGAIYRDLVVGFAYGYWGGRYGTDSAAFTMDPRIGAYQLARTAPDPFAPAWNVYDQAITQHGSAYGMPFGDTFVPQSANPLVNGPTNVARMQMTLRADGATCGTGGLSATPGSPPVAPTVPVTAEPPVAEAPAPAPAPSGLAVPATPVAAADEDPTSALGRGLLRLGADDAEDADEVRVDDRPARQRSEAPVVRVERGDEVALIVGDLPPSTRVRSQVRIGDRWMPLGSGRTGARGRLLLPAVEGTRPGDFAIRLLTPSGATRHLMLRIVRAG